MKHAQLAFCLLLGLCLHCASQRPHVPWSEQNLRQSKAYDLNKDGITDVCYVHDNAFSEECVDWDGDGIPEVRRYFEDGQLVLETYDLNFEGFPSLWLHYHEGKLAFKEWDEDGDGKPDRHEFLLEQSLLSPLELLLGRFLPDVPANTSTSLSPRCSECCQAP